MWKDKMRAGRLAPWALAFCAIVTPAWGRQDARKSDDPPKAVKVTEKDTGRTVTLRAGAELIVELPGLGDAGREWKLVKHDKAQLEHIPKPGAAPGPKEKVPGQTVFSMFRFKALRTGDLELHYVRPAAKQDEEPAKVFKLRVEVQPAK